MTLGQHIQELRRAAGLSQEALGEALGVSRQAISKWEGDSAIPELDKLIALSRLFGISVGRLLQVEEEPEHGMDPDELTDREWRAVEAIAGRYVQELKKTRPKPMRTWKKVCLVIAAAALLSVGWEAIKDTRSSVSSLERRLYQLDSSFGQRVDSMSRELQQLLEAEASLLADWSYEITGYDPQGGVFNLRLQVTPKQFAPGMKATFVAETAGGERIAFEGQPGETTTLTGEASLPLEDGIRFSVILDDGAGKQTQVLDTLSNVASAILLRTWASFNGRFGPEKVNDAAAVRWNGELDIHIEQVSPETIPNEPTDLLLQAYYNGEVVYSRPLVPEEPWNSPKGYLEFRPPLDLSVPVTQSGTLALVLRVTDRYDNISYFLIQSFQMTLGDNGRVGVDHMDAAVENYIPAA